MGSSEATHPDLARLRPRAFAIAYRMLGSVSEAEDIVQEALLRMHSALEAGPRIESPEAYLSTVVTRLSIDELRSARVRREAYVGEWIPEPLLTSGEPDPARSAELADSLSMAFLAVLETLSPEQRAAFLLREVFDYPYADIGAIIERSEVTCRQLVSRARRTVREGRPRFEVRAEQANELADRFFAAVREGDLAGLESLLARDVSLHGDGGGRAPAITRALHGRDRIAPVLVSWTRHAARFGGFTFRRAEVNGQPGAVALVPDGKVFAVLSLDIADGRIQTIRSVVNPDKLGHVGPVADVNALLRRR
jgi:RNA polymerase sigma-70 factor (ECF subfamily)